MISFLPETFTILFAWKNKIWKSLGTNLHGKEEHVLLIKNLKQTFNPRLIFKKKHRGIKFNQKVWLKPYVDMNREVTKKNKKWFWKKNFWVDE